MSTAIVAWVNKCGKQTLAMDLEQPTCYSACTERSKDLRKIASRLNGARRGIMFVHDPWTNRTHQKVNNPDEMMTNYKLKIFVKLYAKFY